MAKVLSSAEERELASWHNRDYYKITTSTYRDCLGQLGRPGLVGADAGDRRSRHRRDPGTVDRSESLSGRNRIRLAGAR